MRAWNLWRHSKGLFNFCPSVSSVITDEARSRLCQSIAAFRAFVIPIPTIRPFRYIRRPLSRRLRGIRKCLHRHGLSHGAPVLLPVGLSHQRQSNAYRSRAMLL